MLDHIPQYPFALTHTSNATPSTSLRKHREQHWIMLKIHEGAKN